MKKIFILTVILMFVLHANATIWRLNNNSGINANFNSWTTAYNGTIAGDTIFVEGSSTSYGDITLTSPRTIIGPGYFLSQNPQTQKLFLTASFGNINLNPGCMGSLITGLDVTGNVYINCGSISVVKNRINNIQFASNSTSNMSNFLICQNYIYGSIGDGNGNITKYNIIISNNIITSSGSCTFCIGGSCSGTFTNNLITAGQSYQSAITVYNFVLTNNIIYQGVVSGSNNAYANNIFNGTQIAAGNNNQLNVSMTTVFVSSGSTDGQWQLKTGSPAIGAGINGIDCGPFSGDQPYVLSGIPAGPSIYQINTTSNTGTTNGGLNVNVKAVTH